MDSKCKYWMLLLTLLCVISLGFSYINLTVSANRYHCSA